MNLSDARYSSQKTDATLRILRSGFFRKEVVGDAIPGVMNSIEEQQQRRRSNPKEGLSRRCLLTSDLCPLFTFYFLISLARRSLGQGGYFPFLYAHRRKS